MSIVAHLGNNFKEYREVARNYWPERCPHCGESKFHRNGGYEHASDDLEPIRIHCFFCKSCKRSFSVLPDFLKPHQSYSVVVEEAAVARYAAARGSCETIGKQVGVSTTTVWRWANQARLQVEGWVNGIKVWLWDAQWGSSFDAPVDDTLRPRWHSRRLRLAGKLENLLLLEKLSAWVSKCQEMIWEVAGRGQPSWPEAAIRTGPWPQTNLGFCRLILPRLAPG